MLAVSAEAENVDRAHLGDLGDQRDDAAKLNVTLAPGAPPRTAVPIVL